MTSSIHKLLSALAALGSASRVASAVEGRRSPAASDLDRLGISATAFAAINKG